MTDRPWAMTLGALGVRQCIGQLTLNAEGKQYCIVFDHGVVVGATSPLASDSAARVAVIHHMLAPAHVPDITRRIAAAPERDEIEVLAEAARLTLDQTLRLRRKIIEQRAARTFSVEEGEFVIDSNVDIPVVSGFAIDVRSVIYLGARMNLSETRLSNELRQLGSEFVLVPEAAGELPYFGFADAEQPILEALRTGTTVAELEARHREIDPRTIQAVIYSLVCCAICNGIAAPPRGDAGEASAADDFSVPKRMISATPSDVYSRTRTGKDIFVSRAPTSGPKPAAARTITPPPSDARTLGQPPVKGPPAASQGPRGEGAPRAQARAPAAAPDETGVPRAPRTSTSPSVPRNPTPGSVPAVGTPGPGRTRRMPAAGTPVIGRPPSPSGPTPGRTQTPGGPLPAGRPPTSGGPPPTARDTTPGAAAPGRTQTPNSALPAGRTPTPRALPPAGRTPTPTGLARTKSPGAAAAIARQRTSTSPAVALNDSEEMPALDPLAVAKEAFKRAQSRLRVENLEDAIVDLTRAVELAPNDVDYAATLAWARFCHASDKQALAQATREALGKAIRKSQTPEMARFYLGRVERMLGRDKEALRHFQEVLEAQPRHADAAAEVRVIEARMAQAAAKESGVFGRKR